MYFCEWLSFPVNDLWVCQSACVGLERFPQGQAGNGQSARPLLWWALVFLTEQDVDRWRQRWWSCPLSSNRQLWTMNTNKTISWDTLRSGRSRVAVSCTGCTLVLPLLSFLPVLYIRGPVLVDREKWVPRHLDGARFQTFSIYEELVFQSFRAFRTFSVNFFSEHQVDRLCTSVLRLFWIIIIITIIILVLQHNNDNDYRVPE